MENYLPLHLLVLILTLSLFMHGMHKLLRLWLIGSYGRFNSLRWRRMVAPLP